ncbi:hypothetical protein QCA50_005243 [Cerrena zonata]|uniref:Uncharacterized protein n=1 Tax=Cerrena zonata TaxID=2478898 RepID=A0AAW0GQK2_9APHY
MANHAAHVDILKRWLPLLVEIHCETEEVFSTRHFYINLALWLLFRLTTDTTPLQALLISDPRLLNTTLRIWRYVTLNRTLFTREEYEERMRGCAFTVTAYLDSFVSQPQDVWERYTLKPEGSVGLTAIELIDDALLHFDDIGRDHVDFGVSVIMHLLNREDLDGCHTSGLSTQFSSVSLGRYQRFYGRLWSFLLR